MDRASDSGSEGWGFESLPAYQKGRAQFCALPFCIPGRDTNNLMGQSSGLSPAGALPGCSIMFRVPSGVPGSTEKRRRGGTISGKLHKYEGPHRQSTILCSAFLYTRAGHEQFNGTVQRTVPSRVGPRLLHNVSSPFCPIALPQIVSDAVLQGVPSIESGA